MNRIIVLVRRRLLAGLVLVVPIVVTIFAAAFMYGLIDNVIGPLDDKLYSSYKQITGGEKSGPTPPVVSVVLTILLTFALLYLLGMISTTFVIRYIYHTGERLVLRIPFIKTVYGLTKQIVELISRKDKSSFKQLVMIEYPRPDVQALAFVTGETHIAGDSKQYVNLFVPTTPNPTSGFLLILPEDQVRIVQIDVESGIKFIMSGGVISPEELDLRPYQSVAGSG